MLDVYTDGACDKEGRGGWAWASLRGDYDFGAVSGTTNQRMEMQAALEALLSHPEQAIRICSDSAYLINCFENKWYLGWKRRGWINSQGKPVMNRDLWESLMTQVLDSGRTVSFLKVKGHSGDEWNDVVDMFAVQARQSLILG